MSQRVRKGRSIQPPENTTTHPLLRPVFELRHTAETTTDTPVGVSKLAALVKNSAISSAPIWFDIAIEKKGRIDLRVSMAKTTRRGGVDRLRGGYTNTRVSQRRVRKGRPIQTPLKPVCAGVNNRQRTVGKTPRHRVATNPHKPGVSTVGLYHDRRPTGGAVIVLLSPRFYPPT